VFVVVPVYEEGRLMMDGEVVKETSLGTLRERPECLVQRRRRGSLVPS
jgi:hypothetical protein